MPRRWFWRIAGGILLELRRFGEAVAALDNIPKKNHWRGSTWRRQAHLGNASAATRALEKALELRPGTSLRELIAITAHARPEALDRCSTDCARPD